MLNNRGPKVKLFGTSNNISVYGLYLSLIFNLTFQF